MGNLLDSFASPSAQLTSDDQANARTLGLLALAGSMVRGDFGGGLLGAGQTYQAAQDAALKRKLTGAQLEDISNQAQLRNAQLAQAQFALDAQRSFMDRLRRAGGSSDVAPGAAIGASPPAGGMPNGAVPAMPSAAPGAPAAPQSGGLLRNLTPDDVLYGEMAGIKGIGDAWKMANVPQVIPPGSYTALGGGAPQYLGDPVKGITTDGRGSVVPMPGAMQTQTMMSLGPELAKQLAIAAGATNLRKGSDNREYPVNGLQENPTIGQLLASVLTGAQPAAPARAAPARAMPPVGGTPGADPFANLPPPSNDVTPGSFVGDQRDIINTIANAPGTPQEKADMLQSFKMQLAQGAPVSDTGVVGGAPNPATGYGKTTAQENQAAANKAFVEGRAKDANAYESGLNGRVAQGTELNMRLQEQLAALDKFRAGGGGETRAQLAQAAQAIPLMPKSVVNGIAGGDLAAMQEFNKLAAQTAMEQLKQSMGGAGRISQYEFKVFQNNNPNLSTDPDAIRKIFEFNNKIYRRDLSEQQAFNAHLQNGGNPGDFPAQWAQQLEKSGVTAPSMNTGAPASARPAIVIKSDAEYNALPSGALYTGPDGKTRRKQ